MILRPTVAGSLSGVNFTSVAAAVADITDPDTAASSEAVTLTLFLKPVISSPLFSR
jgi:hypothetical protein